MASAQNHRYKVRVHESGDRDGATEGGTIVLHMGGCSVTEAPSIESVEASLKKDVKSGKAVKGRVYQIVPQAGTFEAPRTIAVTLDGRFLDCVLESASGFYSEFRRIRYPEERVAVQEVFATEEIFA